MPISARKHGTRLPGEWAWHAGPPGGVAGSRGRRSVGEDSCHVPCPARPAALAAGEAGAELCLPTEGIQSLSAQSCRKATGASPQEHAPARNPLAAHAQQGPGTAGSGRRGQASRAGGAKAPGEAEEQVQPALQQSGDLRGLGSAGAQGMPRLPFGGTAPARVL